MQKYRYSCNTPEEKAVPLHDFLVYFALRRGNICAIRIVFVSLRPSSGFLPAQGPIAQSVRAADS